MQLVVDTEIEEIRPDQLLTRLNLAQIVTFSVFAVRHPVVGGLHASLAGKGHYRRLLMGLFFQFEVVSKLIIFGPWKYVKQSSYSKLDLVLLVTSTVGMVHACSQRDCIGVSMPVRAWN